jgi:ABC-type uncharacterized transport system ATPase subunit
MVCALVLAANEAYGPLFCFWDEPDTYLALPEIEHFIRALRHGYQAGGQFVATSHNSETIRCFSDENTILLSRANHLEPVTVRRVDEIHFNGDLVGALIRNEFEP